MASHTWGPRRSHRSVVLGILVTIGLLAAGCDGTDDDLDAGALSGLTPGEESAQGVASRAPAQGSGEGESWTFLLYGAFDNDLEGNGVIDLLEMAEVGSSDNVNVIAFVDRSDLTWSALPDEELLNIPDFDGAKILQIEDGGFRELADLGEVDSGDPQTLAWFINSALQQFPADRVGLSLWDHGNGPFAFGADYGSAASLAADGSIDVVGSAVTEFDALEIATAIESGLPGTGHDRLDLLVSDACLMANFEFASHIGNSVDYLLASEEVMPGDTFDYAEVLTSLQADPTLDPTELASVIQESYLSVATGYGLEGQITQSLIDLRAVAPMKQAVAGLARALTDAGPAAVTAFGQARSRSLEFHPNPTDPSRSTHLVDLGDLARQLAAPGLAPAAVAVAANSVYQVVESSIVSQVRGPSMSQATGVSIYAPTLAEYYRTDYDRVGDAAWRTFLQSYYEVATDTPVDPPPGGTTTPTFQGPATFDSVTSDGVVFSAELQPGGGQLVTEAFWETGVMFTDGTSGALLSGPAVVGSGSADRVAAGWAMNYLELSDGTASAPITVDLETLEDGLRGYAEVRYQSATRTEDLLLQLTLDPESGSVLSTAMYSSAAGTYAPFTPEPGSTILPLIRVYEASGPVGVPLTNVPLAADGALQTVTTFLAPGSSFYAGLLVVDAAGNGDYAEANGTVP